MAKKRKAPAQAKGPKEVDPKDARLGPISTYADVADSEDEYFMNQDTIMVDDEPDSKRRRKDDDMELSEEEILADDDSESDDDYQQLKASAAKKGKARKGDDDDEDEEEDEDGEEEDSGWWGSSKQEYYNADNIETEADAEEEEVEAKRLQKKKLSKMTEEDFIFDGDEWLAGDQEEADGRDTVTEVLKEVEITDDMSTEERLKLLSTRYPEFEYLVNEFEQLQPVLEELKAQAKLTVESSLENVKYWVLGCYIASLASYFAIFTAPARDASKLQKATDPATLRDHEVMETLMGCRNAWRNLEGMHSANSAIIEDEQDVSDASDDVDAIAAPSKKSSKKDKKSSAKDAKKAARAKEIEASVADLYNLPLTNGKASKQKKSRKAEEDDNSDFGEEDELDARTAADKAARKKSLKFYTSQIVQKANRRAGAGRDAGGDHDIPYRERLRDRQARLIAEAQKRGQQGSKHGAALGEDDSGDEGDANANAMRDEEDDYYDMMAGASKDKKADKAARYAAYAAASKADRVVETEEIGEDGKRKINYKIEKNKGLTPRRSKDVRNPRVKKRKQYEAKQKKLKSMKPVWKGGEPKGGYQGETSGINTGVVKSIKL